MKTKNKKNGKAKRLKTVTAVAAVLIVTLAIFTGCGNTTKTDTSESSSNATSDTEELQTVRVGAVSSDLSQWMGIVEEKAGIFKKHGIDLQITEFGVGVQAIDAVELDQCDIAGGVADYGFINRVGSTAENSTLRIIGQYSAGAQLGLYVNSEKIKSGEDLKGATLATIQGSVYDYWNSQALKHFGLQDGDAELAPITSGSEALALAQSGSADAWWISAADKAKFEELGWTNLVGLDEVESAVYTFFVTTKEFADNNEDLIGEYLEAVQETLDYTNDNIDEVADLIYNANGLEQETFKATVSLTGYKVMFQQELADDLDSINAWCLSNGNYTAEFNATDYIDITALKKVFPDEVTYTE